jgi:hypothetical protein
MLGCPISKGHFIANILFSTYLNRPNGSSGLGCEGQKREYSPETPDGGSIIVFALIEPRGGSLKIKVVTFTKWKKTLDRKWYMCDDDLDKRGWWKSSWKSICVNSQDHEFSWYFN